jgi:hypothetical protein
MRLRCRFAAVNPRGGLTCAGRRGPALRLKRATVAQATAGSRAALARAGARRFLSGAVLAVSRSWIRRRIASARAGAASRR